MTENTGSKVGYGKPPEHTRFRKGQSGNPKGRPRRARDIDTLLTNLLNEKDPIGPEGGRRRSMSQREVIVRGILRDALAGDSKAMRKLFAWICEFDARHVVLDPDPEGPIFTREEMQQRFGASSLSDSTE